MQACRRACCTSPSHARSDGGDRATASFTDLRMHALNEFSWPHICQCKFQTLRRSNTQLMLLNRRKHHSTIMLTSLAKRRIPQCLHMAMVKPVMFSRAVDCLNRPRAPTTAAVQSSHNPQASQTASSWQPHTYTICIKCFVVVTCNNSSTPDTTFMLSPRGQASAPQKLQHRASIADLAASANPVTEEPIIFTYNAEFGMQTTPTALRSMQCSDTVPSKH